MVLGVLLNAALFECAVVCEGSCARPVLAEGWLFFELESYDLREMDELNRALLEVLVGWPSGAPLVKCPTNRTSAEMPLGGCPETA